MSQNIDDQMKIIMDWIEPRLKYLIRQVAILGYWLLMALWYLIPIIIVFVVGIRFTIISFSCNTVSSVPDETLKILISAIGLAATLSGLTYRASIGFKEDGTKERLYFAGNLLFFSTIMFIFALLVNYSLSELTKVDSALVLKDLIQRVMSILRYFLFMYGMIDSVIGIIILRTIFDWSMKKKIKARLDKVNKHPKGASIVQ